MTNASRRWTPLKWIAMAAMLLAAFTLGSWTSGPAEPPHVHAADTADTVWTCSMHPQIRQGEPGQCPICGMDLIPANGSGASEGTERVVLSDRARALASLRTSRVSRQADASASLRLLGRIEPAETTRRNVTTWIGGRIDRLHVNTTGEHIRRGQTIATLYSPDVYTAHQDLITARIQVRKMNGSTDAAGQATQSALQAARQRLRLLGVPEATLDEMAEADEPARQIAIRSPFSGTVIERVATEGAYVQTGASLYRVADLGTLWVQLDAYETDLARLQVGQAVELLVEALPGAVFEGRVDFIEPAVDPRRRTASVRVVVDNPDGQLRPGLFAEAIVQTGSLSESSPLVIPDSAPLFTGRRSVVYIEVETDRGVAYEPRTVRLGPRLGDVYPVVSGLSEGQRVVTRGAFALDADLQIRGGQSMMTRPDDRDEEAPEPIELSPEERAPLGPVLERYLELQRALAEDDLANAQAAATRLGDLIADISLPSRAEVAWRELAKPLGGHATHVSRSKDLEGARAGFEPLSAAVEALLSRLGNPLDEPLHVAFCPMAMDNEGARWVQQGTAVDNAYFGDSMRHCGEIREVIAPGTYLEIERAPAPAAPAGHQH